MSDFLTDLFSPFRYFNFPLFYGQYATVIDGVVFFCLFLSLAKFTFNKYYKGFARGVAWAVSAALTFGLLTVERQLGFNLKSFAWIAIGVILFILFRFIFDLLRGGGMRYRTAFSIAYFATYMSLATWHPNVFDFVARKAPFLNGIAGLLCLVSLAMIIAAAWSAMTKGRHKIQVQDLQTAAPDHTDQEIQIENDELKKIKEIRRRLNTVDDIIDRLERIEKIVKQQSHLDNTQVNAIRIYLQEISKKENVFRKNYNDVVYRFGQLGRIDSERMQRLEGDLKTASDAQRRFIEAELDIERKKIEHDKVIIEFKQKLDALITNFNNLMNATIQQLNDHPESSLPGIGQARAVLSQINVEIHDIKKLERELISLYKTQRELFRGQKRRK